MRLIYSMLFLMLLSVNAHATFSLVANTGAGSTNKLSVTTSSIDTSGAELIVVVGSWLTNEPTLSDNKSNSWTQRTVYNNANGSRVCIYYSINPTVGSGHTFTLSSGSNAFPTISVAAFSKDNEGYIDESGASTAGTSIQPGSVTATQDGALFVTGLTGTQTSTVSINSSFTITDQTTLVSGQHMSGAMAYKIQTSAGAENPTWTTGYDTYLVSSMAVFESQATFIRQAIIIE